MILARVEVAKNIRNVACKDNNLGNYQRLQNNT